MKHRFARGGCQVRWRDSSGRICSRWFDNEQAADEFETTLGASTIEKPERAPRGHGGADAKGEAR
jgi:hypothetical protein